MAEVCVKDAEQDIKNVVPIKDAGVPIKDAGVPKDASVPINIK